MNRKFFFIFLLVLGTRICAFAYVPGHFYFQGHTEDKEIALTFDDGPGPITPSLLAFLEQRHIRATFFMEGTQVEEYASIVRQVREAGHEIGNHTYMHFNYRKAKNAAPQRLVHELRQTETSLQRALHDPSFHTQIVRMPYGYFNHTWLLPTLKSEGYALVHWTFDHEKSGEPAGDEAEQYIAHARPGAIFLFHDGGRHREKTLEVVRNVVLSLEAQGYRFVSADEMINETERP